jgi:GDPmannose 4,6-dehydratase
VEKAVKKALICGVSGQDGGYLASLLLEKGYEVHGTSRDPSRASFSALRSLGIEDRVVTHAMTPTDFSSVLTLLRHVEADEIYNLSGQSSVGLSFRQPLETFDSITIATMHLLECIRLLETTVRFYSAGSSEVFGNTPTPADESTPFRPRSPYATAKAAAHNAVANYREAYGLHASTGILFNHESPFRPERFVTSKVVQAARRIAAGSRERLSLGNLSVQRDWGWAPEYVDAMWRIVQHEPADDFVIATGKSHSLREFVERVFACVNLDARDHVDEHAEPARPSDIAVSAGNPAKAHAELGWKATYDLDMIVREMMLSRDGA